MSGAPREPAEHERYRDDLAAYALGALEEGEVATLRAHLEVCDDCRRHLRWLQPAVDVLPRTVPQVEPPGRLRKRLMATVRAESRERAPSPARARAGRWRDWGANLWRPATAVAAGAILVAGAAGGYLLHQPGESSSVVAVRPASAGSQAVTGTLERQDGSAIMRLADLPQLPKGEVYEAWVARDGSVRPASLFEPRTDRTADAAIPGSLDGADAVLVTREPRGGSEQPTSAPLLRADLN